MSDARREFRRYSVAALRSVKTTVVDVRIACSGVAGSAVWRLSFGLSSRSAPISYGRSAVTAMYSGSGEFPATPDHSSGDSVSVFSCDGSTAEGCSSRRSIEVSERRTSSSLLSTGQNATTSRSTLCFSNRRSGIDRNEPVAAVVGVVTRAWFSREDGETPSSRPTRSPDRNPGDRRRR